MPIRRKIFAAGEVAEMTQYLSDVKKTVAEIVVIDGSPPEVFDRHHQAWSAYCRHEPVDRRFGCLNDKVNGIHTGIRLATNEKIILADDDIRYTPSVLEKTCDLLDDFEVVRPQNYLCVSRPASPVGVSIALGEHDPTLSATRSGRSKVADSSGAAPLPWWAKMEAARMLINRAVLRTADYPGTCAFQRATMLNAGDYDGDVLFDNEEMIRHLVRHGARICYATDLFVPKRVPVFRKWIEQRPRQAYEDFGLRAKTWLFALVVPSLLLVSILGGMKSALLFILLLAISATLVAVAGRRRGAAGHFFARALCLFAPLWILERGISTYWAFFWYLRHGGYPFGDRLLRKGIGRDWVEGGRIASQIAANARSSK
jgi:hypothetical protein